MGTFDWDSFIDNLWERENAKGKRGVEGKGGYRNGKYYPYTTPNGNTDIGPGFDLKFQTPEFKERAKKGFTKAELDSIVKSRLQSEIGKFNQKITKLGGDSSSIPDNVYAGLLDMQWQLGSGLYDNYPNFWRAVANQDYEGMRRESVVTYKDSKGNRHVDTGRRDFRNNTYFTDPIVKEILEFPTEPVDALRVYNPYPTQVKSTIFVPPTVPDEDSYVKTRQLTQQEDVSNRFNNAVEAYQNLNRIMDATSIQNTAAPRYVPKNAPYVAKRHSEGGFLQPKDAWDALSMQAKADVMKVAIKHGLYNLDDIRRKYNEFAEGGSKEDLSAVEPYEQREEVVITPDTEYNMYLNTLPDNQRFTPNDRYDSYLYWKLNGRPKNFLEAVRKGMFTYDHSDNGYHANSITFDDNTGIGYFMKPKDHDTVGYELDWFNKGLVTEEGGKQRPVTPEEAIELNEFRRNYTLTDDPNRPNFFMYQPIERTNGGGIHIKPSHRGRLTELKKRTGKSEAELYRTGSAATRKMIIFARNARKWKHGEGGNLFGGTTQPTQKMQIGLDVQGWPDYTTEQIVAYGDENERRRKAIQDAYLNFVTESNDVTAVANGRPQNQHLVDRAVRGAKAHAAWEKEHPNLTTWGNALGAVPFAIAAAPMLEATASSTAGQWITTGLNYIANAAKAAPYVSKVLPWAEAALATGSATHGIQEMQDGIFTPMTALEISPLVPPAIGIGSNLYLPHFREHLYASKAPIGYDGMWPAAKRIVEGVLSGKRADIENPFWFNNKSAETLAKEFAFVPRRISETEKTEYLKDFGQRALKARADMWRMYNRLPQKYNTFIESEKYPGAYTASEDIKALKWVPFPDKNVDPGDFVNSVGGNVGLPEITNLGKGIPDMGYTAKEFGVTTLSDLWDLHPFSRPNDRLISRVQRGYNKLFNTDKTPEFKWLRPLDNILAKAEVGKLVHAKPILVKNEIPWTMDRKLITDANGNINFKTSYTQGFNSDNILPQSVVDWRSGKPYIEIPDIQNNPENFDFLKYNLVTKSKNR